ncbi:DNA translocase FtsK [Pullulanibacillus sp. KACC 23026]|uniref:DNA translocase FtsK n=1 Tax=Pullulanibacillus sp. KACC 23026 TaxID=3028315 RepID=UPI0023B16B62|nr:DNA translocase FtsK [Pullulanibacillus sp. KACC 23026]WEG13865.1 DNA translocase FtsK [Pullulanibacillus sp. KACC 23026]
MSNWWKRFFGLEDEVDEVHPPSKDDTYEMERPFPLGKETKQIVGRFEDPHRAIDVRMMHRYPEDQKASSLPSSSFSSGRRKMRNSEPKMPIPKQEPKANPDQHQHRAGGTSSSNPSTAPVKKARFVATTVPSPVYGFRSRPKPAEIMKPSVEDKEKKVIPAEKRDLEKPAFIRQEHHSKPSSSQVGSLLKDNALQPFEQKGLTSSETPPAVSLPTGGERIKQEMLQDAPPVSVNKPIEQEAAQEPRREPINEPIEQEAAQEPHREPINEPIAQEAVQEPHPEPINEPITQEAVQEPRPESINEPIAQEAAQEPHREPINESIAQEAAQEPRREPINEPIAQEAAQEPHRELTNEPVEQEAVQEPRPELTNEPIAQEAVQEPRPEPINEPIAQEAAQEPRPESINEPIAQEAVQEPHPEPINEPIAQEAVQEPPPEPINEPIAQEAAQEPHPALTNEPVEQEAPQVVVSDPIDKNVSQEEQEVIVAVQEKQEHENKQDQIPEAHGGSSPSQTNQSEEPSGTSEREPLTVSRPPSPPHPKPAGVPFNVLMYQSDRVRQQRLERKRTKALTLDLLSDPGPNTTVDDKEWIESKRILLAESLRNFNVKADVISYVQGPTVTRFEIRLHPGVKVNKVISLTEDLKLALSASQIRIAPIPGKNTVGIEIPNQSRKPVHLKALLSSQAYQSAKSPLTAVLGQDISGNHVVTDLAKMPHGLIAGATGSGKSVCIHSLILSLIYKATPDELRFILIDPKVVELATYRNLPHLAAPVITQTREAALALKWAVDEMENRYQLFADTGVRDLSRYNDLVGTGKIDGPKLPYIVIVIDELADLMMTSPQEVEAAICRIAQKARAAGIHMLLATQRPSVDVITGLIKSNIPTRIAFSVSSQADSRTILDMSGAERLLGQGDLLFSENGSRSLLRLQGTFVTDEEIEKITNTFHDQESPGYLFDASDLQERSSWDQEEDELFEEAGHFVIEQGQASVSSLQRRFRIGYNRAARLVDQLEAAAVITESNGSKPRQVLMDRMTFESDILSTERID